MNLKFGSGSCDDLRAYGWYVAVHNDYSQKGEHRTFWLMTFPSENGRFVALKGEAGTDEEALDIIRHQILMEEFGRRDELNYLPQIEYLQGELEREKTVVRLLRSEIETLVTYRASSTQNQG